jgi:cyclopropane fatty-acyl-phospholipid synthase-like methyltransferase
MDVGAGIGYWMRWYAARGASSLTALELSPTAADRLRLLFPSVRVINSDVTEASLDLTPAYDVVSVMNVLLHVVDETAFRATLANLARMLRPRGFLILTDLLGAEAQRAAAHVHLRPLRRYLDFFDGLGLTVTHVEPVHSAMNGGLAKALSYVSRGRVSGHRIEDRLAPMLYVLDGMFLARWVPNLRLLIAQCSPNKAVMPAQ